MNKKKVFFNKKYPFMCNYSKNVALNYCDIINDNENPVLIKHIILIKV